MLLGNGTGKFVADPHSPYKVGNAPAGIVAADLNGDHYPDLVVANSGAGESTVSVLLNIPQATHFALTPSTTTPKVGVPFSLTVTALDAFNAVVPSYQGTVHFTSTVVGDSLPGTFTFTLADKGKHVFTNDATVHTTGARTLTVTDGHIKGTATPERAEGRHAASLCWRGPGRLLRARHPPRNPVAKAPTSVVVTLPREDALAAGLHIVPPLPSGIPGTSSENNFPDPPRERYKDSVRMHGSHTDLNLVECLCGTLEVKHRKVTAVNTGTTPSAAPSTHQRQRLRNGRIQTR